MTPLHLSIARLSAVLLLFLLSVAPSFADYPFFAMDPSIRRMSGELEARLDTLRGLGYDGLSSNSSDPDELGKVASAAEKRGLKLYAVYLAAPLTSAGLTLPTRFEEICAVLSPHDALIWLYIASKDFRESVPEGDAVALPGLRQAADIAGRHGIRIALYPHDRNWLETYADAIRVAEKVDRANLGLSFNLCHSLQAGEEEQIPALLGRSASRLFVVTLNGADTGAAGSGWTRLIRPIGEGSYNLAALVKLLEQTGYRGPVGFQAFGIAGDPVSVMRTSIENWNRIVGNSR